MKKDKFKKLSETELELNRLKTNPRYDYCDFMNADVCISISLCADLGMYYHVMKNGILIREYVK